MTDVPGPAYRIRTRNLLIRCWDPADAPRVHEAIGESVTHLLPWIPWAIREPLTFDERIQWLRTMRSDFDSGRDFVYGIFDGDESTVLGGTGLHTRAGAGALEIGYWMHVARTGRGYASEATAALTRVAFEVAGVERVEILCDPANVPSAAVPRKLGFTHEATLRRRIHTPGGETHDKMVWTLLADEYPASPAASAQLQAWDAAGRVIV
ncbi:MAG TPA: GNAT family protein [Longimicrobium sp.]|nr:GNAT family protein [Longimicrobium sp.]